MLVNIIQYIRKTPLRYKITLAVVLLLLLSMSLIGFYFYWNMASVLTKNANDNLVNLIQQANGNIENSFKIIDTTSLHFLSNKSMRSWTLDDTSFDGDFYSIFINKRHIEEDLKYSLMFNNAWDMNLISTAYVFLNEDTYCSIFKSTPNIQLINDNHINIFKRISGSKIRGKTMIPPSLNDKTIYFTRIVTNISNPKQRLVMIFGTEEEEFYKKYSELLSFEGSMVYITDEKGIIYSSSQRDNLGNNVPSSILNLRNDTGVSEVDIGNVTYLIAHRKISDTGLDFIAGIPKEQVLAKLSDSMKNYIVITAIIVFISVFSGIIISLRFTRFVRDMLSVINRVKVGDYDVKMPYYKDNELKLVSNTFNNMTYEIKYLINQVYEKQLLIKETEFKFLQSQMNPHFLFNTLITIGYKAKLSKDETVYKMVTSLTELLQAGIYSNSQAKIPIRQELEFIDFYLYLQKMRFGDKLEYKIYVSDESILNFVLPKLSIEPLIENAVVHGLEEKVGKGTIELNIRRENESIFFVVTDDGAGFKTDKINLDDNDTINMRKKGHNSIGLMNTHKRIKLMYGDPYGVQIESRTNIGAKVTVHIPVDRSETDNV
ncbi:putative sensor with HAMP domain [Ruminiclostridium cellulolyticum H10]|uniref:Putative sensor with HAMP domain n=1 Tax=Ruminiclostridium cellulolyticum (strain ATCC 35319 / DSM 5812 / JCM 6584 / H10) TaxID=394503 RepID=B8I0Y1_RUMCH|nr:putative sensor with HAMP domain [Ruminiclostridium cellulolyticum H10]